MLKTVLKISRYVENMSKIPRCVENMSKISRSVENTFQDMLKKNMSESP